MKNVNVVMSKIAAKSNRTVLLGLVEQDPAAFGRLLMQHPSYMRDVHDAGIGEEVVEIMEEAGLRQTLWAISNQAEGHRDFRMYIREKVFNRLH